MKYRYCMPFAALVVLGSSSCKKEYITNEYITNNEYVTNTYDAEYYSTILNSQEEITMDVRPDYLKKECHKVRIALYVVFLDWCFHLVLRVYSCSISF